MTQTAQRIEIPPIFSATGEFIPLTEFFLDEHPHINELYQRVHQSYTAMLHAERLVADKTRELHSVVAAQRELEARAAKNKVTHLDLVRQMIAANHG